jgi:hypothetical protein
MQLLPTPAQSLYQPHQDVGAVLDNTARGETFHPDKKCRVQSMTTCGADDKVCDLLNWAAIVKALGVKN